MSEPEKCPKCFGVGYGPATNDDGTRLTFNGLPVCWDCKDCYGTGLAGIRESGIFDERDVARGICPPKAKPLGLHPLELKA